MPDRLNPRLAMFPAYGLGLVLTGHGLPLAEVEQQMDLAYGPAPSGTVVAAVEVHLHEQQRVMWCGRHGDPCDFEGEWHTHWHALQPTDDPACQFTIGHFAPAPPAPAGRIVCPVHGIPDCSPLLNGCTEVTRLHREAGTGG